MSVWFVEPAMDFDNCSEAFAAGRSHIPNTDPAYQKKLDRDGDGIACDKPPANFVPATETGTGTKEKIGDSGALPVTGPAVELGAAGALLLMLGIAGTVMFRRRRVRFTA